MGCALLLAACGAKNITNDELVATAVASGNLQYVELTPGTGSAATTGSLVSVHYVGTLQDGTEFDNSYTRGQPLQFVMGRGQVIAGWEKGISQMREGGKARLIIPPALAYGESGAGGVIPPNATLILRWS
ncbi:MAG: FKBP-type peptidyl-prolyl cis-trans isomerase [Chloroflexota bacterium]